MLSDPGNNAVEALFPVSLTALNCDYSPVSYHIIRSKSHGANRLGKFSCSITDWLTQRVPFCLTVNTASPFKLIVTSSTSVPLVRTLRSVESDPIAYTVSSPNLVLATLKEKNSSRMIMVIPDRVSQLHSGT